MRRGAELNSAPRRLLFSAYVAAMYNDSELIIQFYIYYNFFTTICCFFTSALYTYNQEYIYRESIMNVAATADDYDGSKSAYLKIALKVETYLIKVEIRSSRLSEGRFYVERL